MAFEAKKIKKYYVEGYPNIPLPVSNDLAEYPYCVIVGYEDETNNFGFYGSICSKTPMNIITSDNAQILTSNSENYLIRIMIYPYNFYWQISELMDSQLNVTINNDSVGSILWTNHDIYDENNNIAYLGKTTDLLFTNEEIIELPDIPEEIAINYPNIVINEVNIFDEDTGTILPLYSLLASTEPIEYVDMCELYSEDLSNVLYEGNGISSALVTKTSNTIAYCVEADSPTWLEASLEAISFLAYLVGFITQEDGISMALHGLSNALLPCNAMPLWANHNITKVFIESPDVLDWVSTDEIYFARTDFVYEPAYYMPYEWYIENANHARRLSGNNNKLTPAEINAVFETVIIPEYEDLGGVLF